MKRVNMKRLMEMKKLIGEPGNPMMDPHFYMARIPELTERQRRCMDCTYFQGFRSKIPVCKADECCFEEEILNGEEEKNGN